MSKINLDQNKEIDLLNIILDIWDNKYKFITIIIVVTSFFFNYNLREPIQYKAVTELRLGDHSDFIKYINLNKILILTTEPLTLNQEDQSTFYQLNPSIIFDLAINEFLDYEEIISVLKKYPSVQNKIQGLTKIQAEITLASLAKKFEIKPSRNKDLYKNFELSLTWHDDQEGMRIFEETLTMVLQNIKEKIANDINQLFLSNRIYNKFQLKNIEKKSANLLKLRKNKTQSRIKFLEYQLDIANKLGIMKIDGEIRNSKNIEYSASRYYLMGSEAINLEIMLLKDLDKETEYLGGYEQQYSELESQIYEILNYEEPFELIEFMELIKSDNERAWLDYNFNFATIENNHKSPFKLLLLGSFLGFIVACAYLIISHVLRLLYQLKRATH
jgi:LPS O-antigen subunit length determinant protein (WzzB/FepE family)